MTTEPAHPRRILVVDDDKNVRETICDVLRMLGYAADAAGDPGEALERFRAGRYHLVVTDLSMPIMNGWQLARRLQALQPALPILIFSGASALAEPPQQVSGITIAAKPDVDALARLIERMLEQS
jgi:CheY-like chemotaxis protein